MEGPPSEFISHHRPLLFLAGVAASAAQSAAIPSNPTHQQQHEQQLQQDVDPFVSLLSTLRKVMAPKRGYVIWDNSRGVNADFHVIVVDKNIKFPPLKAKPSPSQPGAALHSPISPLSPSSPLYPDGIMAPIWIRKHREMVPAVFLLVLRLQSQSSSDGSFSNADMEGPSWEEVERARDADLVREVVERKRSTIERGIKLAVILLCDRRLLDDPSLDLRLSLIRRQSGLDSRASLFVISPVPESEVVNFVASLKTELHPAAMDYLREHGRRVRRKRARAVPKGGLSDKGWNVRYDYKLACFAEMRSEIEVSLKHYEDCYDNLVEMFANSLLLVPRTKRWAEAKVLADCLTIKICKMYFYINDPSRSLAQLNRHLNRFRELSNSWGIGEQTFEFWSWLSKQYRLFAELVSIAVRAGFRLPSLRPPPPSRPVPIGSALSPSPGLVPAQVIHHAAYYYYLSGACAVERRNRFRDVTANVLERGSMSAAIAHESKVDHAELIIDLLTRAYEEFKSYKTSRMSLFIASKIALAHYEGGNHAMAFKFHERIARTYRREGWNHVLAPILRLSLESATALGDYDSALRILFELLSTNSLVTIEQRNNYAIDLVNVLRTQQPTKSESRLIIDPIDAASLFDCRAVFWKTSVDIGRAVPFQLSISSPINARTSGLTFSHLVVSFNNDQAPIVITNTKVAPHAVIDGPSELYPVYGIESRQALLSWQDGSTKVFEASVFSSSSITLKITSIVLTLVEGDWTIDLALRCGTAILPAEPRWSYPTSKGLSSIILLQPYPSVCEVRARDLSVAVNVSHDVLPAYLDEQFAIHVDVQNLDEVEVEVFLDILVQPGEDDAVNQVVIDDQATTSLIKAVSLGQLSSSASMRKTFRLICVGNPGLRQLDVVVRCVPSPSPHSSSAAPTFAAYLPSTFEFVRTLQIPAAFPIICCFDTKFYQCRRPLQALLDLNEPTGWEGSSSAVVVAKLGVSGPQELEIMGLHVSCDTLSRLLRVTDSSLDLSSHAFPLVWQPHDRFQVIFRLDVAPQTAATFSESRSIDSPFLEVSWKRRNDTITTKTSIPFPSLRPRPLFPSITLRNPAFLKLHAPSDLIYTLSNPSDRLLALSLSVEGSEGFVFSGIRKASNLLLAPGEERVIRLTVVPLIAGSCSLPRLRVFEQEERGSAEDSSEVRLKEWLVFIEDHVDVRRSDEQLGIHEDYAAQGAAAESTMSDSPGSFVLPR